MPTMIDVTYTLWLDEERTSLLLREHTSALPAWAELPINAEVVVQKLCRDWIDENTWEGLFGTEEASQTIRATIATPPWLSGDYEVALRRVIQVEACKVVPPQPPRALADLESVADVQPRGKEQ
jgi:hypothetical protein